MLSHPLQVFLSNKLNRTIHFQVKSQNLHDLPEFASFNLVESYFISKLVLLGKLPDLLLLRTASGLLDFLERAHMTQFETPTGHSFGVIWNDIKSEHIYWDASRLRFTLIDWGNAQFLENDGVTKDRQHSRTGDLIQFIHEIGRLAAASSPELFEKLSWPEEITPGSTYSEIQQILKESN